MRGGHLHNNILIGGLRAECSRLSLDTQTEVMVLDGDVVGFMDLVIDFDGYRIGVEAELTAKRVQQDLWKAEVSGVSELWFLVPNKRVEKSIRKKLAEQSNGHLEYTIFVLTLGIAIKELRSRFSLIPNPNPIQKTNNERNTT